MHFRPGRLAGLVVIEPRVFGDERGFFQELFHRGRFAEAGLDVDFVQDNLSRSKANVVRGLHYQIEQPQGKLVRVLRGEIFDVAVDLRRRLPLSASGKAFGFPTKISWRSTFRRALRMDSVSCPIRRTCSTNVRRVCAAARTDAVVE